MPLLKPDIRRALVEAGLDNKNSDDATIKELLEVKNLTKEQLLNDLADLISAGENEATKLRAIELTLKLHGVLRDQPPQPAPVTIIIQDPESKSSINPVVLPRQLILDNDDLNTNINSNKSAKKRKSIQ